MIKRGIGLLFLCTGLILMSQSTVQAISEHTRARLNKKVLRKLFEHFLDKEDSSISWKCFARGMAHNLAKSENEEHQNLAEVFKALSSSTSPTWIGVRLLPYRDLLKEDGGEELLNKYSPVELQELIDQRLKLNDGVDCKQLMRRLLHEHDEL